MQGKQLLERKLVSGLLQERQKGRCHGRDRTPWAVLGPVHGGKDLPNPEELVQRKKEKRTLRSCRMVSKGTANSIAWVRGRVSGLRQQLLPRKLFNQKCCIL